MFFSTTTRESIKTALAMTVAYGIALSMDWERPYWAGFTVAFISLATIGQSLNKGMMRLAGTLLGCVIAMLFIALFPQDRWGLMLVLSAWAAFCAYMSGGASKQYFWSVCGIVSIVVCIDAGPDAVNAFHTVMLRAQETTLGVIVYSLVAILLWPNSSRPAFERAAAELGAAQHALYRAYYAAMQGQGDDKLVETAAAAMQAQTKFGQLLDAAETDSYEIRESRASWRAHQRGAAGLAGALERWRESFRDIDALDLERLLPGLRAYDEEIERRLRQIEGMLGGTAAATPPAAVALEPDAEAARGLPHLSMAAVMVACAELAAIERLTRSMFEHVAAAKGFADAEPRDGGSSEVARPLVPDPDRIAAMARVWVTLWIGYLLVIVVGDFPGGFGFVTMAGAICIVVANIPHVSLWHIFVPAWWATVFAGVVYVFVMPHLSSFAGLSALLFTVTFAICQLFAAPQQAVGRAFGLAMFLAVTSISNEQTYSFLSFANTALIFPLAFLLLAASAHVPHSPRSERAFMRVLARLFTSCRYLTSSATPGRRPAAISRWRTAYHQSEVSKLPARLAVLGRSIDPSELPGGSAQPVQAVVAGLDTVARRMQVLLDASAGPQAQAFVRALGDDFREWRAGVEESFRRLADDPGGGDGDALRLALARVSERLERRVAAAVDELAEGEVSAEDYDRFYRLLGAYRALAEALVSFVEFAHALDWDRWREERFA
ncbi:MAG: FUSC family protein [Gammaproteobacteria bacterium]